MLQTTRCELLPGVFLTAVQTKKFKTNLISVNLLTPLSADTAAVNALIPMVLCRGTEQYPDMVSLAAALDQLYGGSVEPMVRKKGETQCIGLTGSFLDDAYAPGDTSILEDAAQLMGDLLLHPALENGVFRAEYVSGEKDNLADQIRAQINEKRSYSLLRLIELMCAEEAYGTDKYGRIESLDGLDAAKLWSRYQALLREAPVEIYYCGSAPLERVKSALQRAFADLPEGESRLRPGCRVPAAPESAPRCFEERLDVTQGKLVLGFRTGGIVMGSADYPALMLCNAVYGGTTTSKLFMHVRERLSLCYFASSLLVPQKGVMLVSSGIEFDKYQQAKDEILAQLELCRKGEFSDEELEAARHYTASSLKTTSDAHGRLEEYWVGQCAAGQMTEPETLAAQVMAVSRDDVIRCAGAIRLDSVYFMRGKEA